MGLDITARIVTKASIEMEKQYMIENWPKVESGEITEDEYFKAFPVNKTFRSINVSEDGIRNFWGLRKFFIETLGLAEEDGCFYLGFNEIKTLWNAANYYEIPDIDNYSYSQKCGDVFKICTRALKECHFETELVEFSFFS